LLLVGVFVFDRLPTGAVLGISARMSIALGAGMILPMLNLVSLLIPNAAVLLFPGWFQAGQESTWSIETTGQRLIFAFGQLVVFLLALVPAGVSFLIMLFLSQLLVNWIAAVPLASMAAMVVLGTEAAIGIGLLGRVFERFDLSAELSP
jgi:hypothetical protein